eukprot:1936053-Rhodomonas_salina.1
MGYPGFTTSTSVLRTRPQPSTLDPRPRAQTKTFLISQARWTACSPGVAPKQHHQLMTAALRPTWPEPENMASPF